jgi:hypothetical protein
VLSDDIRNLMVRVSQQQPESAGAVGERCAEAWLKHQSWDFMKVEDQAQGTMARKLRDYGGKRPDFLAMDPKDGGLLVLDAKHVSTANRKTFTLTEKELTKYRGLRKFIEANANFPAVVVAFMVIPKESKLSRMVFVLLDDFATGEATQLGGEPALSVSLLNREALWTDINPEDAFPPNKHKTR